MTCLKCGEKLHEVHTGNIIDYYHAGETAQCKKESK